MSAVGAPARARPVRLGSGAATRERVALDRFRQERSGCSDGGRVTLERRLDSVWEALHAVGAADCPMCGTRMSSAAGGGRCGGCGTRIG